MLAKHFHGLSSSNFSRRLHRCGVNAIVPDPKRQQQKIHTENGAKKIPFQPPGAFGIRIFQPFPIQKSSDFLILPDGPDFSTPFPPTPTEGKGIWRDRLYSRSPNARSETGPWHTTVLI
jgi:hypothetical protein